MASGCSFRNPAYKDTETDSQTIGSGSGTSGTFIPETDSEPTETTETPTTETPTTEGSSTTIDEPSETGEGTIDPSETTTTVGSTSTDTDDTDDIDDICMPPFSGQNALVLNVLQYPSLEPVSNPCHLDNPGSFAQVIWDEEDLMQLSICNNNNNCEGCDDSPELTIEMYGPNDGLLPTPDTIEGETCVWFQFDTNKPSGDNKCTASSLVLLDFPSARPRFVMIDDQWERPTGLPPSLEWEIFHDPECLDCLDCCEEVSPGTYAFKFLSPEFEMDQIVFPGGPPVSIDFYEETGKIKVYDALMTLDCEPHVEFIFNTYYD